MRDLLYNLPAVPTVIPPPDLTGVDSQYYHPADRYAAYLTGQQLIFDQTLYQEGLIITPENSVTPWVYGVDWSVTADDVDSATIAVAVGLLPSFSHVLVKSITILHAQPQLPLFMDMATHSFYPRPENLPPVPTEDEALTALLDSLLSRLALLESEVRIVTAVTGDNRTVPAFLDFDINGHTDANVITAEPYTVNTFTNQNTIRPIQGSFFKDSIILTVNGVTLTKDVHYQAVGLNAGKTKLTQNPTGIYDLILVTYPYAGPILVTYRAVGGDASVADLTVVYEKLVDIKSFLDVSGFLTPDQLATSTAVQNILKKTTALENQMRVLLSPQPNYGDTTNGVTVVKHLAAPDTGLHWWTIGRLYQVTGSPAIVRADRMELRFQMTTAKLNADVGVGLDLNQSRNPFVVNAHTIIQDVQFSVYGAPIGTPATVTIPQFRVLWNADSTYTSGAILQIGLNLPTLTDIIAIEDRSGVESCWLLDTTQGSVAVPLSPNDNTLVLPNGTSTWVSGGGTSTSKTRTMPNERGYLIWTGSNSLATFDTTVVGNTTLANSLPNFFLLQDIVEVVAEFTDAAALTSRVVFPMTGYNAAQRRGIAMVYMGQDNATPVPMEVLLTVVAGAIVAQVKVHANVQAVSATAVNYLIARVRNTTV